tara:strand:- start:445 stop:684 length:240 start_codon:yes stop_codon:yes gene_type:complete
MFLVDNSYTIAYSSLSHTKRESKMTSITQKISWSDAKFVVEEAVESQIALLQLGMMGTQEERDADIQKIRDAWTRILVG